MNLALGRLWQALVVELSTWVGPAWAPYAAAFIAVDVLLVLLAPWLLLPVNHRIRNMLTRLEAIGDDMESTRRQILELKQAAETISRRLDAVDTVVRFGPEGPRDSEETRDPGTGIYDYCPSCREIRFMKFSRCQSCGHHR